MNKRITTEHGLGHPSTWLPNSSGPGAVRRLRYTLLCMLLMLCGGSIWAVDKTLTIDFESAATAYTDWTFVNFASQQTNSNVSAHGGSYFGNTNGKESGSVTTKEKISSPKSIVFYISKQSTNTTESSWLVQVSSDGDEWTTVGDAQSASSGITRGTWTEVSRDLSSYSNVFVRIAYDGTTAIRTIDDITLTYISSGSTDTKVATVMEFADGYATKGQPETSIALPTVTVKTSDGATTLSNPEINWESSNTTIAEIDGNNVNLLTYGIATITATFDGDDSYNGCDQEYTIRVCGATEDGIFNFATFNDYGSGYEQGSAKEQAGTWTAGNVTMALAGRNCWFTDGTLRIYKPDNNKDNNGKMTFSVPSNYAIKGITISGGKLQHLTADGGSYTVSSDNKTGTWIGNANSVVLTLTGSDNSTINTITITYGDPSINLTAPTFDPAAGNYYGPQNVTLACTTEGADIYYFTDGENISKYTAPIEVSATTTISAYSQVGEEKSATVTATYTIRTLYTTIAQLHENVTGANTPIGFQPESVTVVYVNGNNGYLVDNAGNGLLVFNNSGLKVNGETDLAAGQVLTGGMIRGSLVSYQGSTEISGFTTEGTTITSTEVTPVEKTLPLNTDDDQSTLVTVKGLTYTAEGSTFSDGTNTIAYYDKFKANPTLEDGKKYDVTAIAVKYDNAIQLCPRTAADVTEYVAPTPDPLYILGDMANWDRTNPTAMTWDSENEVYTYTFTSTADATYFCFADGTQTAEEAAADNEWTTFNSTYRWALGTGGNYTFDLNDLGTTLELTQGDKTIVLPAGEWTISVTADKKLTITGEAAEVTPTEDIYVVAGGISESEDPGFFGTSWDTTSEANTLEKQADGTYTKTYENVEVAAGTTYHFKFVKNGEQWIPDGTDNNLWYWFEEGGTYNITITYDPNTEPSGNNNMTATKVEEPATGFRDIKANLTQLQELATNSNVYITVDAEGNIGTTDDETKAAATLKGGWHGTSYGWTNFSAVVPVEGCVKITYATHDYGDNVTVTNSDDEQVATFNTTGPKWSSDPSNVVVAYYRTNEPTTLTFSQVRYNPYFAVEAIDEADLPAEVTTYNVTFAAGEGVQGVAPAAIEVEAGNTVTAPKNTSLYKESYTLIGWESGNEVILPGAVFTPAADMTLTAKFGENEVSLDDREDAVTVTWQFGQSSGVEGLHFEGNSGIVVTQATVNGKTIDVQLPIDATSGKFYNKRGDQWAQVNINTTATVPTCKGATISVTTNGDPTSILQFGESTTFAVSGKTATFEVADDVTSVAVKQLSNDYWSTISVTLPVVEGDEPGGEKVLYSWESPEGNVIETGGKIEYVNGEGDRLNYPNNGYYTICLNGKKTNINDATPSANAGKMVITLDKALHEGDKINMTAYITNSASKTASAYVLFETGTSIDGEDYDDAANIGLATPGIPTTTTITVPKAAAGSKTITLTRSKTGTNLFITKLVITSTAEDDPNAVATPEITPATGTYTTEQEVTITCATEGATIYYTTDGTEPTAESTEYTEAFTVTETTTVKAIAINGEYSSEIAESVITITEIQPGQSDLIWDYTETAPASSPDNGLTYGSKVDDASVKGVKLNGSGFAWFTKNPVEGKLTLTFGLRSGAGEYAVNVYSCGADGTKGDLIGEVSVSESPGTGSIVIPATVTGVRIERKTGAEGVLSKIVFKEIIPRTFVDFEITNDELKGTYDPSKLPTGVDFSGTPHNDSHGYQNATIVVPTDGGAVKFTIGGCQYANPTTFTVTDAEGKTVATLDQKTPGCYHNGGTLTYFYTGEATTLTFGPMAYLPYFKAEAVEVEEVTVTFKDQNGNELGKKTVFEGEAIGEIPYTETDLTIPEGYAFRGWIYTNGVKVKATDIVDGNKTVMASVTAIEEAPTTGSIQVYDLTQSTFYPEDHENFDVNGGKYNDGQHGWDIASGGSFSVKVAGKAQVVLSLCEYGSGTTITVTNGEETVAENVPAKAASGKDGATTTVNYNGEATTLTFTFATQAYLHSVTVFNVNDFIEKDEVSGYYIVPAGDAVGLVLAINSAASEENSKIFLPNGTYDLGELVKTGISGSNVSIIGESMDGVIIKTTPDASIEGLGKSDLFQNSGTGLYLQDLTLQNAMAYSGNNARAAVLHDMGTNTICKNVKMLSYQDTYYSHKTGGLYYFEGGEIHGAVDYVCGNGKVYFNEVKFVNEQRSTATVSANSELYVFNNCTIENNANSYNLGRAWSDNPVCVWLNTTLNDPSKLISTRWNLTGINCDYSIAGEYGTKNAEGTDITPESNNVTFTKNNTQMNTILSADQAAIYTINYVLGDWAATAQAQATQVAAPKATLKDGVISWTPAYDGATAYAIFKDGKFLGITTENSWTVEDEAAPAPRRAGEEPTTTGYTIRAANSRGGFGEPAEVSPATGINATLNDKINESVIYDLNGRRVMTPTNGVYIINGKKVVIK